MKKLITIASLRAVLGFWFIVSLVVMGNVQTVKAEETPTVEGEWVVISTNDFDIKAGDRCVVVRQGDGYSIRWTLEAVSVAYKLVDLYRGTATRIMVATTLNYDDLAHMYAGTGLSDSALMEWAGRIPKRYQFTLSEDGRSAEYANDKPRLSQNPQTGGRIRNSVCEVGLVTASV